MKQKRIFVFVNIITCIVAGILFFSYNYVDMRSLTQWSLDLLDVTFEGDIYEYYQYTSLNLHGLAHEYMGASFLPLIPWAIWNIPIWILQRWFGIEAIGHAWTLLYSKMFLVMAAGITVYWAYRLTLAVTGNSKKSRLAAYLCFAYPFTLISVLYAGQTDIISLMLFTIAAYHFIGKKKHLFVLFSILSIGMKPYVLIAYIALVLMMEKNIWKIIGYALSGCSLILLFGLVYGNAPMYQESMAGGPVNSQLNFLLGAHIPAGLSGKISLFVMAMILFYFIIYTKEWKDDPEKGYHVIYILAVSMLLFFMLTEFEFYRLIYLMPFLFILFTIKEENFTFNMILESIFCIGVMLISYIKYFDFFFFNENVFQYVNNYLPEWNLFQIEIEDESIILLQIIASTIFFAALLLLLIINHPKCPIVVDNKKMKISDEAMLIVHSFLMIPLILLSYFGL